MTKWFAAAALVAAASGANAQTTVSNGQYQVGIGANGELFNNGTQVGFQRTSDRFDPLLPGTPRDSWGVAAGGRAAYADQNNDGTSGITGTTFTGTGSAATTVSSTTLGLSVTQAYSFIAPNILRIGTTVTNLTGAAVSALFQRNVDWDVDTNNYTGDRIAAFGTQPSNVIDTTNDGFDNPNPNIGFENSCAGAGCTRTGDVGGGIKIDLGSIAAGGATSFSYYYGIGTNLTALLDQARSVGVTYGLGDSFGTNSAFIGIGSPVVAAVPEPATWAMLILGFGVAGFALRRRRVTTSGLAFAG